MYEKFANWKNFPDESTPVTAAALNHFEQGITDVDVTRPGSPAEVELSSRLSATAGSAEGLVQAERAAREAAVTAEQSARVAAIEAEDAARKTAIIGESDARIAALALKANADAVYTKAQVDAAVSPKANSADVYTKAQSDTALGLKADKTAVYTKAETYTRTETGAQITNAITASRPPLYGTGFPNGVVAAPVGTLYSDEAVTNGASLWQKIAGTGTSGWRVVSGETGWRNIGSLISAGITVVRALIVREVSSVHLDLVLDFPTPAATTSSVELISVGSLPVGWRPAQYESVIGGDGGCFRRVAINPDGGVFMSAGAAISRLYVSARWSAGAASFPSTTIGTN